MSFDARGDGRERRVKVSTVCRSTSKRDALEVTVKVVVKKRKQQNEIGRRKGSRYYMKGQLKEEGSVNQRQPWFLEMMP